MLRPPRKHGNACDDASEEFVGDRGPSLKCEVRVHWQCFFEILESWYSKVGVVNIDVAQWFWWMCHTTKAKLPRFPWLSNLIPDPIRERWYDMISKLSNPAPTTPNPPPCCCLLVLQHLSSWMARPWTLSTKTNLGTLEKMRSRRCWLPWVSRWCLDFWSKNLIWVWNYKTVLKSL